MIKTQGNKDKRGRKRKNIHKEKKENGRMKKQ